MGKLLNSLIIGAGSAAFATLAGTLLAWIVVRTDTPCRGLLEVGGGGDEPGLDRGGLGLLGRGRGLGLRDLLGGGVDRVGLIVYNPPVQKIYFNGVLQNGDYTVGSGYDFGTGVAIAYI